MDSRSTPNARADTAIFPADCTASVCMRAPRSCASAAMAATGCTVPTSLFACITDTSAVVSDTASRTASGETTPLLWTGTTVRSQPRRRRPSPVDGPLGLLTKAVDAGPVADQVAHRPRHRLDDRVGGGRSGVVIEIDPHGFKKCSIAPN